MTEILGIAASVAGLISLAQNLVVPLVRFIGSANSSSNEVVAAVEEIRSFCGVLCVLQPVLEQVEKGGHRTRQAGFIFYVFSLTK